MRKHVTHLCCAHDVSAAGTAPQEVQAGSGEDYTVHSNNLYQTNIVRLRILDHEISSFQKGDVQAKCQKQNLGEEWKAANVSESLIVLCPKSIYTRTFPVTF